MNYMIWISLVLILIGVVGYYVAYFKGKKAFAEQMSLYQDGILLGLNDVQELYQAILAIRFPGIKGVWLDDDASVVVEGRKRKHKFYLENGTVKIKNPYSTENLYGGLFRSIKQMSIHRDISAMVESNQIMDTIAAGQQDGNVKQERGYGRASTGFKILCPSFVAIILGAVLLCLGLMQGMNDEYIGYAKAKCPVDGVDVTYEDIFNFYLGEPEWDYFESDQNKCIVEVSGTSSIDNDKRILVQFAFVGVSSSNSIISSTPIDVAYMEINGQTCTAEEAVENLNNIVQSCMVNKGLAKEDNATSSSLSEGNVPSKEINGEFEENQSKVYDGAGLFTEEEINNIQVMCINSAKQTELDVMIVTTDDAEGKSSEEYADDFYDNMKFGYDQMASGILFLIDMDNREYYISTAGKAIEYFNDDILEDMINSLHDYMVSGDYYTASEAFITAVTNFVLQGGTSSRSETDGQSVNGNVRDSVFSYNALDYVSLGDYTNMNITVDLSYADTVGEERLTNMAIQQSVRDNFKLTSFPPELVDTVYGYYVAYYMNENGVSTMQELADSFSETEDELHDEFMNSTVSEWTSEIILEAIADSEGLQGTEEGLQEYISTRMSWDSVLSEEEYYSKNGMDEINGKQYLKNCYKGTLAIKWIKENANISYINAPD